MSRTSPGQEIKEWNRKQRRLILAAMFITVAVSWVYVLLSYLRPWSWLILGLQVALTGVFIALLARFVLRQRAEYWLARGKDSKHPERNAKIK